MKTTSVQPAMRDRTYREVNDGDYLNQIQYLWVAISLCVTHFGLEFLYIWLGCTPMVFINIISFLCYVVSIGLVLKGRTMTTVWIMILEIYFHVIFASIFLGMSCGYQLWLFGALASIFLPFFSPDLSSRQKKQIGVFSLIIIATFMALTALNGNGLFPDKYNASPIVSRFLYYFNAILGFGAVMLYTAVYNTRMTVKNRELQMAADHDYLTGIFNRQRMQRILVSEVQREQDVRDNTLAVAIADIDFFKKINDTYGHIAGDEALKELTNIFKKYSERGLLFGRWGGEEFLLIAPEDISYSQFTELLEDIRKQVEAHKFVSDGQTIRFTISIGGALYEKGMSVEKLVNTADDRLYKAKESGRNKVVFN